MTLIDMCESDDYIRNSIRKALDAWIDGGGMMGPFFTEALTAAKFYYGKKHSEWRGALLLYLLTGAGLNKISKDITIQTKLLMLDCLNKWEEHVKEEDKDEYKQMHVLTEVMRVRDYCKYNFGSLQPWCIDFIDRVTREYLSGKFWVSCGASKELLNRIP